MGQLQFWMLMKRTAHHRLRDVHLQFHLDWYLWLLEYQLVLVSIQQPHQALLEHLCFWMQNHKLPRWFRLLIRVDEDLLWFLLRLTLHHQGIFPLILQLLQLLHQQGFDAILHKLLAYLQEYLHKWRSYLGLLRSSWSLSFWSNQQHQWSFLLHRLEVEEEQR